MTSKRKHRVLKPAINIGFKSEKPGQSFDLQPLQLVNPPFNYVGWATLVAVLVVIAILIYPYLWAVR